MKRLIILFAVLLSACNSDSKEAGAADFSVNDYPQQWDLMEMSGMMVNSHTSGEDMEYQESYLFREDNTFSKTRRQTNAESTATGTYKRITLENGEEFFELTYHEDHDLIENCSGDQVEFLSIVSETSLKGTAVACDWPAKRYERTQ